MGKRVNIFGLFYLLATLGCGTTDYDLGSDEKLAAVSSANWRENALLAKSKEASITMGSSSQVPEAITSLGLNTSDSCPTNTVCFKAPYFGEEQLSYLANQYSNIFSISGSGSERVYSLRSGTKMLIESDLFQLNKGARLNTCANPLTILSSEASGEGIIDSAASHCEENNPHAGDITIVSETVEGLQIFANGRDGSDGKDGIVTWERAKDGDANALRFDIDLVREPVRICLDFSSCLDDAIRTHNIPTGAADYPNKVRAVATDIAEVNLRYLDRMGVPRSQLDQWLLESTTHLTELGDLLAAMMGAAGCWFVSDPAHGNRETGFVTAINPKVSGFEGLNGEDARLRADGSDGESGGNAGRIDIVAKNLKIPKPESIAGKAGRAGKSYVQAPGKGSAPAERAKAISYPVYARLLCELFPEQPKDRRQYFARDMDFTVNRTFQLGESYGFNRHAKMSTRLGEGHLNRDNDLRGTDGASLTLKSTVAGTPGVGSQPTAIQAAIDDLVVKKFQNICPKCEIPKALKK